MRRSAAAKEKQRSPKRLELVLDSSLESVDLAETLVQEFAQRAGCSSEQQNDICLAVRESVLNAVVHGNHNHPTRKVFLKAALRGSQLAICVRDEGRGFRLREVPDPRRKENLLRESGRGILLMQALMDRLAVRRTPQGTEVRLVKFLSIPKREEHKMSLRASSREVNGVTVVDLSGRIVLGEATATLRDTLQDLIRQGRKKVLLNLGDVSYVDSSGLGALVSGFTTLAQHQGELKLLNLTKKVKDLLQITKLLTVFDVYDDEASAVRSFR